MIVDILFQNNDFVVCDKKALTLSVPARDQSDPRPCLGIELQNLINKKIYPVHRLDYEVSGLIMYALNQNSHKISQDWFQSKLIQKTYLALTTLQNFSHWPENVSTDKTTIDVIQSYSLATEFSWKTKMLKGKKRTFESDHGEWAFTNAKIMDLKDQTVKWQLKPITGKSHQLRFELSRRGFPILGDQLYGSQSLVVVDSKIPKKESYFKWSLPGIALRSVHLDLTLCDYQNWKLPKEFHAGYMKEFK